MRLSILFPIAMELWQVTSQSLDNSTIPSNVTSPAPLVTQVPNVLTPLNNPSWNASSANESISLQPSQHYLWGSHNNSNQTTVLSLVVYTPEDQLIVSMERFAHQLKSVDCSENMTLTFNSNRTFGLVQQSWNWVNFNGLRTFILVADYPGCGKNESRNPWVVSNVQFDSSSLTVYLDAVLSTWKEVAQTYTLDFGEFTPSTEATDKRLFSIGFDKSFTVDLTSTLPTDIFSLAIDNSLGNVSLALDCHDCGTTGDIVFSGHVEASLFSGITVLQLSATPHNVAANLNLTLELDGELNMEQTEPYQVNEKILTIPLPGAGFTIPDLITFGPNAQVSAGFALDSLEAGASIEFGVHASIPNTAVAVVDLHSKQTVDIHGWEPVITTQPLEVHAEIEAQVELYTELAIAVSLLLFGDDGFQLDLGLRAPDVFVTVDTVYDSAGVCNGSTDEFGVIIDATVGAELLLEGYAEAGGSLDELLTVTLFSDPDIFSFPEVCIPFSAEEGNVCPFIPDTDDEEVYDQIENLAGTKRDVSTRGSVQRRASTEKPVPWFLIKRKPYYQGCDPNTATQPGKYPIQPEAYPSATAIVSASTTVPVYRPGIPAGCTTSLNCSVENWTLDRLPGTRTSIINDAWSWDGEHIYEGNWVRDFMNYMDVTYFGLPATSPTPTVCPPDAIKDFFQVTPTSTLVIPTGNPPSTLISPPPNYIQAIMQNLGTWNTYQERMAILPQEQNSKKSVAFSVNKNIYADFQVASSTTNQDRFCKLGRMVSICQYLNDAEVQSRLSATIIGIHSVLDAMQSDTNVVKPDINGFTTFRAAHQTWFEEFWTNGTTKLQSQLKSNAQFMLNNSPPAGDVDTLNAIVANPAAPTFCFIQPFTYPTA